MKNLFNQKKIVFISIAVAIVIAVVAVLINMSIDNSKLDLASYATITVDGLNTQGIAKCEINKANLSEALKNKNLDKFSSDLFYASIKSKIDKDKGLKNGDKVTATISYDDTLAKQFGISIKNTQKEVSISGLEQGKETDIFKDVTVSFSGTSPKGKVSIINKSSDSFLSTINFTSSEEVVKNGDKIIVTADYDQTAATKEKILIKNDKKEFTVTGLGEYLANTKQLNQDIISQLNKLSERSINEYLNTSIPFFINHIPKLTSETYVYGADYSFKNIVFKKAYIITQKENAQSWFNSFDSNEVSLIYSVDIYVSGKMVATTYLKTNITDVIIKDNKADGTLKDTTQYDTFEKAQQAAEDISNDYNIEPVTQ